MKINYFIFLSLFFLTSCATIIGGSKYDARITVRDNLKAVIEYKGAVIGQGFASTSMKRSEADKVVFRVKQEGCAEQLYYFKRKDFRPEAFLGTLLGFTSILEGGIPMPFGAIVDLATGALFKPSKEEGVIKESYKKFNYLLIYEGCQSKVDSTQKGHLK